MADEAVATQPSAEAATPAPAAPQNSGDKLYQAWQDSAPSDTPAMPANAVPPAVDPNAPAAAPDPLEAVKDNPRVIELLAAEEQHKAYQEVLQGLPYAVSSPEEMKSQLTDAAMLYDIVGGKVPASAILDIMLGNEHWTPEQKQGVLNQLAEYIGQKTGKPIAAAAAGQPTFSDPVQKELADIKGKLTAREDAEKRATAQAEQTKVQGLYDGRIKELCKDFPEDSQYYSDRVAAKIAGNPQILAQIAKGNFAQVNKALTEERNADIQRFKRWSDALVAKAKSDQKTLPKQVNGAVAPTTAPLPTFKNDEERKAHMLAAFQNKQ
jgi:hypothetical protein